MICQRIGRSPIGTIGLGRNSVSSRRRVPKPPQKITTFIRESIPDRPTGTVPVCGRLLLPVSVVADNKISSFLWAKGGAPDPSGVCSRVNAIGQSNGISATGCSFLATWAVATISSRLLSCEEELQFVLVLKG